jgi:hypothetical protein
LDRASSRAEKCQNLSFAVNEPNLFCTPVTCTFSCNFFSRTSLLLKVERKELQDFLDNGHRLWSIKFHTRNSVE